MAIVSSKKTPLQYDRDVLDMFFDEYGMQEPMYKLLVKVEDAPPGKTYTAAEISGLGEVEEIPEGAGPVFDVPVEGHSTSIDYVQYGLGFQHTEIMMEDLIHDPLKQMAGSLGKSMLNRIEVEVFKLLNLGATALASGGIGAWDSKPIFATNHVTMKSADTISNLKTAALSETGLQAMFEYFDNLKSEEGFPLPDLKLSDVWVNPANRWMVTRLAKQMGGISSTVDLSGNDMTTNPKNGYVDAWTPHITSFITDTDAWYCMSKKHQFKLLWKRKVTVKSGDDFQTGNRLYKSTMRFGVGCLDYKPVVASVPT